MRDQIEEEVQKHSHECVGHDLDVFRLHDRLLLFRPGSILPDHLHHDIKEDGHHGICDDQDCSVFHDALL